MAGKMQKLGMQNLAQLVGKGVVITSKIVDKKLVDNGTIIMDSVWKKPSTYVNVGGGIALQLLSVFGKMKSAALKEFLLTTGSYMSAEVVSVVVEATGVDIGLGAGITARRRASAFRSSARGLPNGVLAIGQPEFAPTQRGGVALF